jgi:hypothetical protein
VTDASEQVHERREASMSSISDGARRVAQRIANAEAGFVSSVMERIECSKEDALKVLFVYRKARVVKLDAVSGVYRVSHGAFWDREVLIRALKEG